MGTRSPAAALRYLRVTQEGQQWAANLYANICQKKCGQFACRSAGFLYFSFSLIHRIRNVAFRPQWRIPSGGKSSRQAAVLGTAITRCG
jgi:hypothetical protein